MRRTALVSTLAVSVLAAFVPAASVASAAPAAPRHGQPVHADGTGHIVIPSTLRPGLVDLRNTGTDAVVAVRRTKYGVNTFVKDWNDASPVGFVQHWITQTLLAGGTDQYLPLKRGTYYLADGNLKTISASLVKTVTVTGSYRNAVAPAGAVRVTVSGSHSALSAPAALPTHGYLSVRNLTSRFQIVNLDRIGPGTSDAQLRAFVRAPSVARLRQLDIRAVLYPFYASGGQSTISRLHTSGGRYLLVALTYTHKPQPSLGKGQARVVTLR